MTPPPVNVPSCRMAKRVGGSNSVIVDRVRRRSCPKIRTVASPRVPTPIGPVVSNRTAFISCIQRGWPSMSASDRPDALDRRIDDDERFDRRRRLARRPGAAGAGRRRHAGPDAEHAEPDDRDAAITASPSATW